MIGQPQKASEFNGGLITDRDAALLAPNQSPSITNADMRFRAGLRKLPGSADWKDDLPTGLTPKRVAEMLFSLPSSQQVTILYGKNGSEHQLWVRPYIDMDGDWVDDWQNITEYEGTPASPLTVAAGSGATSILVTGLASTTTNYYKGWVGYNEDLTESFIIASSSYSGGTTTLTPNKTLTADPTGDSFWITRNHAIDKDGNYLFSPQDDEVEFLFLRNAFIVLTGSDTAYPAATDLWCGYVNQSKFQDSGLDWQGIHCTRNSLSSLYGFVASGAALWTPSAIAESDDIIADGSYSIQFVAEYDGYQEGPIDAGDDSENGFQVGKGYGNVVATTGSAQAIEVDITANDIQTASLGAVSMRDANDLTTFLNHIAFERRITGFRVYMAEVELVVSGGTNYYQPIEEWRFVRKIGINESGWAYNAGTKRYDYTFQIYGRDYQDAAIADLPTGIDLEGRQGHTDLHVYGNAKTGAVSRNRVFYANTYLDEQRESFFISTPINSDGLNTPSVMPWTSFSYDTNVNGISQIIKIINVLNRVIVLGKNDLLRIDPNIADAGFSVADQYRDIGGLSSIGVCVVGGILYFASDKGIMAYLPNASQIIDTSVLSDISEGAVQNAWRDLGVSVREATAIGWCKVHNYLVLSNSSGTWAFHLGDKNWTYYGSTQYIQFAPGIDGELIGVTSAGAVKELFADTPDESTSLTYYSPVFYGPMLVTGFRAKYKSDVALTVSIIDKSNDRTLKSLTLPASSSYHTYRTDKFNVKVDLLQYAITSAAATTNDLDILSLEPFITPLSVQPL